MLDVLGERLGGQLDPLDHRQVGEELIGEVGDREVSTDCEGCGLDDLATLGCQDLGPQQSTGISFRNQLDEATGVEVGQRPGHVFQRQGAAFHLETPLAGSGLGEADRAHLGIG